MFEWEDLINGVSDINADDINDIAHEVIRLGSLEDIVTILQQQQAQAITPENLINISYLFSDGRNEELRTKLDTSYAVVMDYTYRKFPYSETVPTLSVRTANCESMQHGFDGAFCEAIEFIGSTPKLKLANHLFNKCTSLETVTGLDLTNATIIKYAFYNCTALTGIDVISTAKVTDMSYAFYGSGLTTIEGLDTSSVTNLDGAFAKSSVTSLELNCSNVTTAKGAFAECTALSSLKLNGMTVSVSVAGLPLNETALNALFTSLGTASTGAKITITGCTGAETCDKTIATEKGWNVE